MSVALHIVLLCIVAMERRVFVQSPPPDRDKLTDRSESDGWPYLYGFKEHHPAGREVYLGSYHMH